MEVHKFRVLLDTDEDVFRDIEIDLNDSLESMHKAIINAFDLSGEEMASFFDSTPEWVKGDEIPLMDMGMEGSMATMQDTALKDLTKKDESLHLLYVYDFLNMWCFYVSKVKPVKDTGKPEEYPKVTLQFGTPPEEEGPTDLLKGIDPDPDDGPSSDNGKSNGHDPGDEIDDMFRDL